VHQCLRSADGDRRLAQIVLTASGGPFRGRSADDLASVTVEQALAHPTWSMGPKITVDSSTLVNKGLEVIEAHELFGVDYDRIDVVVHPQSIVHSMATFTDGATIAQLSMPDMRLPNGYALAYPDRIGTPFGRMDFSRACTLEFEPPDRATFRGLDLAYEAGRSGGTAPAWLSAANEVAVDGFLSGAIAWADIAGVIAAAMDRWDGAAADSLDAVLDADGRARASAEELLAVGVSS
jgi:1-deoxy-D-xylulose-5-phosphate reductoisomerase